MVSDPAMDTLEYTAPSRPSHDPPSPENDHPGLVPPTLMVVPPHGTKDKPS